MIKNIKIYIKEYNIYQKKIEFNIVNLKYIHLNSDILSESMAIKLKNRRNKILKVLTRVLKLIKLPSLHHFLSMIKRENLNFNEYKTLKMHFNLSNEKLVKTIISSINNKKISGIRIEAAGRLTKRLTASRSIFKIKYKRSTTSSVSILAYNNSTYKSHIFSIILYIINRINKNIIF